MAIVITNKAQMKEIMKDEAKALVVRFCQLNGYAVPKLSVEIKLATTEQKATTLTAEM